MTRPGAASLGRIAVAVGLTAYMLWRSEPGQVGRALADARLAPILAACALVLIDRALMAYRWLVLLRPFSSAHGPSFGAVMRIFFVSTFVGTFLPASVGGDAVRAYALARENVPGPAALASVLMDRMLGVLSILILAAAGLAIVRSLADSPGVVLSIGVTAAACVATAAVVFSNTLRGWAARLATRLPGAWIRSVASRLLDAVGTYATRHGDLANVLVGSLAVQVLRIMQAWLLGVAVGIAEPLLTYAALIPIILLVMLLPVSINGIGVSQAAFVWFFGQAGVAGSLAFALSVLFVALGIVGNLPGGFLYLTGGLHGPRRAGGPA